MFKFVALCSALAVANAAYLTATHPAGLQSPAIISQSSDIQRGQGGFSHVPNYQRPFDASYYNQRKFENPNESYQQPGSIVYDHPLPSASQIRDPSVGAYPSASSAYPSASSAYPSASGVSRLTYNADPPAYTAASASALAQTVSFAAAQGHPITHTVAYTPTYADQSVGTSRESEIRSHAGNRGVTHYTKAVDTAFSSVRKSDARVTNDAKIAGTAPALTYTTSSAAYASPLVTKANYATPGVLSYSNAPTVAHATFAGHGARYTW